MTFPQIHTFFFVLFLACSSLAGDWPTYRHDATRSACTEQALPDGLKPVWTRVFPAFEPAFPNEPRQQFDASYEPVCADGIVVVGSPVDGSIRGFSAETGEQLWVFHTEAPVRIAPALHNGKVLAGSDDGMFRCLDLRDGKLIWAVRSYPEDRPDARLLGNNRLISMWPVRGGPVVVDSVVYFGAGVWPTMGVYVHALDIDTGKPAWTTSRLGHMENVRIDHNYLYDAGASPQGYLLATADKLVLPNGRSHPLALNRADGSLFHFVQGYRNGDCHVAIGGNYAFVGARGIVNLVDFREVGSKWVSSGKDAPNRFDLAKYDQFEGPATAYKHFPGCTSDSVFDGNTAYSFHRGVFYAHDLSKAAVSEYEEPKGKHVLKPFRWDAPVTIRLLTPLQAPGRLFLKAGKRLYGHAGKEVFAIELTGAQPAAKLAWKHPVNGTPSSMIAAADRLMVVLSNGTVVCFAAKAPDAPSVITPVAATLAPAASPELKAVLAATGVREGICVVLGGVSVEEADAAIADTALRLLAVSPDAAEVCALRENMWPRNLYGKRLEALSASPLAFVLPKYLASLLWVRGERTGPVTAEQLQHVWHSVRPYGGILCYTGSADDMAAFRKLAAACYLQGCRPSGTSGACVVLTRHEGPEGAADWTHETADPARSFFSHDTAVKTPIAPLWYGDGPDYGFIKKKDYGRGVKPQVVQGRVFALQQFSRTLFAYDAYTGRRLWSRQGEGKMKGFITRFVSRPDGIYAGGRGVCVVYDPATGKELRTLDYRSVMPKESKARCSAIVVDDTSVVIAAANEDTVAIETGLWDADVIICLDRETGAIRWHRNAKNRFNIKALALGGGLVFCTDSMSPLATEHWKRRAGDIKETESTLVALDEATGAVRWQYQYRAPYYQRNASGWMSVRTRDDWLAYSTATGQLLGGREQITFLIRGNDGDVVWEKPLGLSQPIVLFGETLLDQGGRIIKLADGEQVRGGVFHRGGCNYAVANENLVFVRDQTVCAVDLASGEKSRLRNMRSGCSASIVPASGILNIPNFAQGCVCNYPVQTSSAWVYAPEAGTWGETEVVKVSPLHLDTGIPRVTAEEAKAMHAFKRRFLVDDPTAAAEHLVGRWTFDAAVPGKPAVFPDLSGRKADCTVANPAFEARGDGKALTCGADSAKTVGKALIEPKGIVRDAVTLCAWVKLAPTQHGAATGVVERQQFYRVMVNEAKAPYSLSLGVQLEGKSWRGVNTPKSLKAGEWYHVAAAFDGEAGESVIYLNGKKAGEGHGAPGRIPDVTNAIQIGVRDGGAYLNGALDDVRVYDRALGPKAIAALFATDKTGE